MKRDFVKQAIQTNLLPVGPIPSRETIRQLQNRWHDGQRSVDDYYDSPRSGRPREVLPTAIEKEIHRVIRSGRAVNAYALTQILKELAEQNGVQAPTYRQVHRRFAAAGRLIRASSRHGSRAGEIDGLPHARIISRAPHDTWALDELTLPVWVRIYDDIRHEWVSARSDVVLIIDVCSGAVVGYWVVDPGGRRDELGAPMRAGFDAGDVLAALLSAASPDLASDSTREFAGYLPDRLRLDNAKAHKTLEAWATKAGVNIDFRPIRVRRAASNGAVERRVDIMKKHCAGIRGHVDEHLPTDQVVASSDIDPALERTKAAAYTSDRLSRLIPILPDDLHSVAEIRFIFDGVVRRYNYQLANRVHGLTPIAKYKRDRARRPRRGIDLVRAIEPRTVKVGTDGIVHTRGGVSEQYYPLIEGTLLMLDTVVTFHPDPVGRGIFVVHGNQLRYLRPQDSRSDQEAAEIARNHAAITRTISDGAERLREAELVHAVGLQGLDAALDEFERKKAAIKGSAAAPEPVNDNDPDPRLPTMAEGLAHNPWAASDPGAFIRRSGGDTEEEE
jgi:hypothetical protein